jgi:hypothetical protein
MKKTIIIIIAILFIVRPIYADDWNGGAWKKLDGITDSGSINVTGDVTVTGDVSATDMTASGDLTSDTMTTASYFDFTSDATGHTTNGRFWWNGTNLNFRSGGSTTDILQITGGTGYWSKTGNDINYTTGTIAVGAAPDSTYNSYFYSNDNSVVQGVRSVIEATGAVNYYGVTGTVSGASSATNVGLYGWASGSSGTNLGLWVDSGLAKLDAGLSLAGGITSLDATGHYIDVLNATGDLPTCDQEGRLTVDTTVNKLYICDGANWEEIYEYTP